MSGDEDRDDQPDRARVQLREGQLSDGGTRFRLLPSIETFPASTGDLHLLRPGEAWDLVVRGAEPGERALIRALAGQGGSLAELARATGADPATVAARLDALAQAGVLVTEDEPPVALAPRLRERFDRQLPYLAEHDDPGAAQLRLRGARVVVLGCGGLGTWALGALASTGIGRFVLIDDDRVELSNLNRQVLYGERDVGRRKADCAAAWLHGFDPELEVTTHRNRVTSAAALAPMLEDVDVLVQTADRPAYAIVRWVDAACRAAGVPYILGGQRPPVLRVGPTFIPGRTACFSCQETALARAFPLYLELCAGRDERPPRSITLGPASGIAGTLVALEVMHLLLGRDVPTAGRALLIDMRTLETRWEAVERLPDCPACHHPAGDA